jgi:hypothetical protein
VRGGGWSEVEGERKEGWVGVEDIRKVVAVEVFT